MVPEVCDLAESPVADVAAMRPRPVVHVHVGLEVSGRGERLLAELTFVRLLLRGERENARDEESFSKHRIMDFPIRLGRRRQQRLSNQGILTRVRDEDNCRLSGRGRTTTDRQEWRGEGQERQADPINPPKAAAEREGNFGHIALFFQPGHMLFRIQ